MITPRKWLPTPVLSILLLLVWLLLVRIYAFGQLVLGGALAILIPLLTHRFWDARPRIDREMTLRERVDLGLTTCRQEIALASRLRAVGYS